LWHLPSRIGRFDMLLEQRVHQRTQRNSARRSKLNEIVQYLRLQMNLRHEASAFAKELATLGGREIIFVLHRIILAHWLRGEPAWQLAAADRAPDAIHATPSRSLI